MKIGDIQLQSPYRKGQNSFRVNDLTPILFTLGAVPNQITVYQASNFGTAQQVSGTYTVTQIGGQTIAGCTLTSGTDGPFNIGDLVLMTFTQAAVAATNASAGGSSGQIQVNNAGTLAGITVSNDVSINSSGAATFLGQSSVITPVINTAAGTSTNNWNPSGWLTNGAMAANVIRVVVNGASDVQLTGITAPSAGQVEGALVTLQSSSSSTNTLHLLASSANSNAANRFGLLSDVWIDPSDGIQLMYDATLAEWREFGPHRDFRADIWGSGFDGIGPVINTTLSREVFYTNWTPAANTVITTSGFPINVSGMLDLSACTAGTFVNSGASGSVGANGTTGTASGGGGASAVNGTNVLLPPQVGGTSGGNGTTTTGNAGTASVSRAVWNLVSGQATSGGAGGLAGPSGNGAGGAANIGASGSQVSLPVSYNAGIVYDNNSTTSIVLPAMGGCGGAGGGGDGTNGGGGGGGGGATAGTIKIRARKIYMGANATVGILQCIGGGGGNGGPATGGNGAGGGGAGAGGGGPIIIEHFGRFGTGGTNACDITGGNGGNGGAGHGTGANGNGGQGGASGVVIINDLRSTITNAAYGGNAAKVVASGANGGLATVTRVSI